MSHSLNTKKNSELNSEPGPSIFNLSHCHMNPDFHIDLLSEVQNPKCQSVSWLEYHINYIFFR